MVYLVTFMLLITSWFLPWWTFTGVTAVAGYFCEGKLKAFLVGFFAVFVTWIMALYYLDLKSHGQTAQSLAGLMKLPGGYLLILSTALGGALLAGLAGLAGRCLRDSIRQ